MQLISLAAAFHSFIFTLMYSYSIICSYSTHSAFQFRGTRMENINLHLRGLTTMLVSIALQVFVCHSLPPVAPGVMHIAALQAESGILAVGYSYFSPSG
jgi:hypothetical protein